MRARANVREAAAAVRVYSTENGPAPANVAALAGSGFQQTDPPVTMTASGSGGTATFCVASVTNGGNVTGFEIDQADSAPKSGTG